LCSGLQSIFYGDYYRSEEGEDTTSAAIGGVGAPPEDGDNDEDTANATKKKRLRSPMAELTERFTSSSSSSDEKNKLNELGQNAVVRLNRIESELGTLAESNRDLKVSSLRHYLCALISCIFFHHSLPLRN
jgi:hypothetical protein